MNLPNLLTSTRIAILPILVVTGLLPGQAPRIIAATVFSLAALTDWLDGYLARKLRQASPFGQFLDPVADKLLVSTALLLIVNNHDSAWLTLPAIVIIGREISIASLRQWMAETQIRFGIRISQLAKIKTAMQMIAIVILLLNPPGPESAPVMTGYGLLYLAALLTLWSMVVYLKNAWPKLRTSIHKHS